MSVRACVLDEVTDMGGELLIPVQLSVLLYSIVPVQSTHADVILKRKFTVLQTHSYSYFITSKGLPSSTGSLLLNAILCTSTIQQQFLWTFFSRCCQFFTFLSFCSLCLHGSLRVCGACRREGQSGRRRSRRDLVSQLHNMGDLQSLNPVILTHCCDPSPLQAAAQAD